MAVSLAHTPEPWRYHRQRIYAEAVHCRFIASTDSPYVSAEAADDNARRIVACINACAGISTAALEAISPGTLASWRSAALAKATVA